MRGAGGGGGAGGGAGGGGEGRIMKVVSERVYVNDNGGETAKTGGMYLHGVFC